MFPKIFNIFCFVLLFPTWFQSRFLLRVDVIRCCTYDYHSDDDADNQSPWYYWWWNNDWWCWCWCYDRWRSWCRCRWWRYWWSCEQHECREVSSRCIKCLPCACFVDVHHRCFSFKLSGIKGYGNFYGFAERRTCWSEVVCVTDVSESGGVILTACYSVKFVYLLYNNINVSFGISF